MPRNLFGTTPARQKQGFSRIFSSRQREPMYPHLQGIRCEQTTEQPAIPFTETMRFRLPKQ
jgi:hypothetical protein